MRGGNRLYAYRTYTGLDGYSKTGLLWFQKVQPREEISAAWQQRCGHTWVIVNEVSDSVSFTMLAPTLTVHAIPGLPGYVVAGVPNYGDCQIVDVSESDDTGRLFLQIPGNSARDLEDLDVVHGGAEDWMGWAATLYKPLDSVLALTSGANAVTIGPEGDAEWRNVTAAAALHITGQTAWYLYDDDFKMLAGGVGVAGDVNAPAGSHLVVFGAEGASVSVTATP